MPAWLADLWAKQPALLVGSVVAFADAILTLLIVFAVPITPDQKTAILGVVTTGLVIIGALVTRGRVWSPDSHDEAVHAAFENGHEQGVSTQLLRDFPAPRIDASDNLTSATGRAVFTPSGRL